jgi:hypothetical protein
MIKARVTVASEDTRRSAGAGASEDMGDSRPETWVTLSIEHVSPKRSLPFASIVWHAGEQPEVSAVTLDVAPCVEQTEGDRTEADTPTTIGNGFEPDELVS